MEQWGDWWEVQKGLSVLAESLPFLLGVRVSHAQLQATVILLSLQRPFPTRPKSDTNSSMPPGNRRAGQERVGEKHGLVHLSGASPGQCLSSQLTCAAIVVGGGVGSLAPFHR